MHGIRDVNVAGAFLLSKVGEMKDNTVKADQAEVYENRMLELFDEYMNTLDDEIENINIQITRTPIFKGALKYIYLHLFALTDNDIKYDNKQSNIDYNNISLIYNIWSVYTSLCYKYKQNPTFLNFSILTGIDNHTLGEWQKTENDRVVGSSRSATIKKMREECESAAYDVAMSGNPGGMFVLKACYGYTEQPQQIVITQADQGKTPEQIAAEHMHDLLPDNSNNNNTPPAADF